jgi:hypothetical protein
MMGSMQWAGVVCLLLGCGRIGFGAHVPDAAPDAQISLAESMTCGAQVLMDQGGHDPHDVVRWIHDPAGDWLVGAHHYGQDDHKIERHAITYDGIGGFVAAPAEFMVQGDHIDVLSIVPTAAGSVLGWTDFVLGTGQTNMLAPGMQVTSANPLGPLAVGNPPLARIGGGALAMMGIDSASSLMIYEIGEDATPTGRMLQLVTAADGAVNPSAIAIDQGLAVTWVSSATGSCKVAVLSPDLVVMAGPVNLGVPCGDPHVAWLPASQRLIVVADDPSAGGIQSAVFDATLTMIDPPKQLSASAHWSRIVGEPDHAWVTWARSPTPQPVMYAELDADANVIKLGDPVGTIDETLGHFHTIDNVGYTTMIVWVDTINARTFSVERLCP